MKETDKKPSERINEFLLFLESAKREYESAYEAVGKEDASTQDLLHELEFSRDKNERNRVATKFQQSRRRRREQKDKTLLYEKIYKFYTDNSNQHLIKALRRLMNEQVGAEKYLSGERKYTKRVNDDG